MAHGPGMRRLDFRGNPNLDLGLGISEGIIYRWLLISGSETVRSYGIRGCVEAGLRSASAFIY